MNTNPIDIITKSIQDNVNLGTRRLAEVVADALDHEDIVAEAVAALEAKGYAEGGVELADVARIVLRSVGGRNG